jgi:hypothetical protein
MNGWLRCRLDDGMFSDEMAVTYPATQHERQMSVFVPSAYVRPESKHCGDVMVEVLEAAGARFAVLPSSERDIVRIEAAADLRHA